MTGQYNRGRARGLAVLLVALIAASAGLALQAQTVTIAGPDGKPVQVTPEQMNAMRRAGQPVMPAGAQPGAQPGQEAKPDDKKKEGEEGKKKEGEATIKRPEKPPRVPDPREFKVKLDDKGRVPPFNFIGQPWPDVMQWLATLSKCTLDWQELPNDYLNLTTDRPYPLSEVHNRINRALQARGFTSIRSDDVLSVFKIDKIDVSLVPKLTEEQLYDRQPYDIAKVSFELPAGMEVDKAKDDVKQVLSSSAKVFPLVQSKRILIMDTVANLRTVSELFNTERMIQDGRIQPKVYFLKYARPQQVIEILYMMVGADPKGRPQQTDPAQQQQQMQMIQQMQQQGRAADVAKMMQPKDAPKVYLAYNRANNSVIVNAPPDQLKIIEQTIHYLDVPFGEPMGASDAAAPADSQRRLRRYPLQSLDPDKFVQTLEEMGGLSPNAVFKADDNNKTLFVMATEADHKKVESLLRDFDGSGRHFEVIWLRRLPADSVAGTIYKLMAGQNEKKDDNNRRRYFDYYDFYGGGRDDKKKDTIQGFGVEADVENNRILLWATDVEMERVRELLAKLGELPSGQPDTRPVRFVEPTDGKPTSELLKELRDAWKASGGNDLIINVPPEPKPVKPDEQKDKKDQEKSDKAVESPKDRSAESSGRGQIAARFVELGRPPETVNADSAKPSTVPAGSSGASSDKVAVSTPTEKPAAPTTEPAQKPSSQAPVVITQTPDGRLMLSSPDTAALDRLEQLIEQISPPQRRFHVYRLNYLRAVDFYWDVLHDYFKEDLESKGNDEFLGWFYGPRFGKNEEKTPAGLSKRKKLMLTWDPQSNSILVANASASQTAEIEQLIREFDQPTRSDSVEKRKTAPVKIYYSKPSVIAAAVKEVYRDLLSAKDKEFDRGDQKEKKGNSDRVTIIDYAPSMGGGGDGRPSQLKLGFEGALSLGADDVSGVLIVSAQSAIFDNIVSMVHELDQQAAPKTTVQVYQVHGAVRAEALQKALDKAIGKAWLGNRPEQQPNQTGPEAEKKNAENQRGRNRNERSQEGEK